MQNAKKFLCDRLPVPLSSDEEKRSAAGAPSAIIYPYTGLRMLRPGVARGIVEDGMVVLYHCMDNSRYYIIYCIYPGIKLQHNPSFLGYRASFRSFHFESLW
jgi:hypothetical protein